MIDKLLKIRKEIDLLIEELKQKPKEQQNSYDFIFCFPTRGRPQLFKKQLDNLYTKLSNKYTYQVLITIDTDDKTMNNRSILKYLSKKTNLKYQLGASTSKINAVNRCMNIAPQNYKYIVLLSDDMTIVQQNFDHIIFNQFNKKNGPITLNFNDGRRKDWKDLCTLSIMNKQYYDKFNYLYHPSYKSEWCDNEFTLVAKSLNALINIDKVIVKHQWVDITGRDQLFLKNREFVSADRQNFIKRQKEGFQK